MKRFRFSLRTLAILIALLCFGLASWHWTATRGVEAIKHKTDDYEPIRPIAPFLLVREAAEMHGGMGTNLVMKRSYYIWFFGLVKELPFMASQTSQPMTIKEFEQFTKNRR